MDFLEFSYSQDFSKQQFLPRSYEISGDFCQIFGAPKSGKTSFVLHFLQSQPKNSFLYMDLDDLRCDIEINDINIFLAQNKIELLVIDNFKNTFSIPKAKKIIITTDKYYDIAKFKTLFLKPLFFEEFLLFDKKHQNITASFNYFLKFGNLPQSPQVPDFYKMLNLQECIKLIANDKSELLFLKKILASASTVKSVYQLFTALKKEMKVSKDRFYEYFNLLVERKIIFLVPKYNQPKISSKIMIYNHAMLDAITTKKNFNNSFENMVFLELLSIDEDIFYIDGASFFLPNKSMIVLSIPFFNQLSLGKSMSKLLGGLEIYDIKEIKIITVASTQKIFIGNIEASVEPFYEWALAK